MRGLLTVILFTIFFFSFSIAAYTYSINSVFSADYVKERLDKSKIYSVVADELPEFVGRSQGEGDELVPVEVKKEFKAFVKKEVSGQYLQGKIEPFVDDIFAWLSGKTNDTPQLSFADLAVKLKKQPAAHFLSDDMNKVLK